MSQRLIRDGWLDSACIDAMDAETERFFLRLCLKADDFGRFTAHPQLVKSALFPLKENVSSAEIRRCLHECERLGAVRCYELDAKPYLEIVKFDQRLRSKVSKYPSPQDESPAQASGLPARSGASPAFTTASPLHVSASLAHDGASPGLASVPLTNVSSPPPVVSAPLTSDRNPLAGARHPLTNVRTSPLEGEGEGEGEDESKRKEKAKAKPVAKSSSTLSLSLSGTPTEAEFLAHCQELGVPDWYARDKFLAQDAKGWKSIGKWRSHAARVRGWYETDGRGSSASKPGQAKGNGESDPKIDPERWREFLKHLGQPYGEHRFAIPFLRDDFRKWKGARQ